LQKKSKTVGSGQKEFLTNDITADSAENIMVPIHHHLHHRLRGNELKLLSRLEHAATIKIIPIDRLEEDDPGDDFLNDEAESCSEDDSSDAEETSVG